MPVLSKEKDRSVGQIGLGSVCLYGLGYNTSHQEAIISFAAHCLNSSGTDTRFSSNQLVQSTYPLDARVSTFGINNRPVTDDIVNDDEASLMRKFERPREVVRIVTLVRINEDQVKLT